MNTKRKLFMSLVVWALLQHCAFAAGEVASTTSKPTTQMNSGGFIKPDQRSVMLRYLSAAQSWKTGLICLVSVGEAKSRDGRVVEGVTKLVVEDDYGDTPAPAEFIIPSWSLQQLGTDQTLKCKPGDILLICVGVEGRVPQSSKYMIGNVIGTKAQEADLLAALKSISDYRRAASDDKAEAILKARKEPAVLYVCFEWVLDHHVLTAKEKSLLREVRDDASLQAGTRHMASRALLGNDNTYEKKEHVRWLRTWFEQPQQLDTKTFLDLLNDIRNNSTEDFESVDVPMMVKLLDSPKIGDEEFNCILMWLSDAGGDKRIDLATQDKIIHLLFDKGLAQTDVTKSRTFLGYGGATIQHMMHGLHDAQENRTKVIQMLDGYENLLDEGLKSTKRKEIRQYLEMEINVIKTTKSDYERAGK